MSINISDMDMVNVEQPWGLGAPPSGGYTSPTYDVGTPVSVRPSYGNQAHPVSVTSARGTGRPAFVARRGWGPARGVGRPAPALRGLGMVNVEQPWGLGNMGDMSCSTCGMGDGMDGLGLTIAGKKIPTWALAGGGIIGGIAIVLLAKKFLFSK